MSFIDKSLTAGEKVILRAHVHWAVFLSAVVVFSVFSVLCVSSEERLPGKDILRLASLLVAAILAIDSWVRFKFTELALTDARVIGKTLFFTIRSIEIVVGKVEGIEVHQSLLGNVLNNGTIMVTGTGTSKTPFLGIVAPLDFRRAIQERVGAG